MDILAVDAFLSTRVTMTTAEGDDMLLGMLKYLCGRLDIGLVLDCRQGIARNVLDDASYAVHNDAESHSGAVANIGSASMYA